MSDARWTCWYWPTYLSDPACPDIPVPYSRSFGKLKAAVEFAKQVRDSGNVSWVKVFASRDEHDERFRWPKVAT